MSFFNTKATGGIMGFGSQVNADDQHSSRPAPSPPAVEFDPSGRNWSGACTPMLFTSWRSRSPSSPVTGSMAVASVGAAGTALYVNGAQVASSTTPTTAQNYVGWWSLGYASIANWNDVPSSYYFSGSLAQAAVIPTQLTAAQVSSLYGDNTLASYTAGVEALGPTNYWPMNDSGAIPYEGSVPGATASTTLADYSGNSDTGTAEAQ